MVRVTGIFIVASSHESQNSSNGRRSSKLGGVGAVRSFHRLVAQAATAAATGSSNAARNGAAAATQRRRGTKTASAIAPAARMPAPTASRTRLEPLFSSDIFLLILFESHYRCASPSLSLAHKPFQKRFWR